MIRFKVVRASRLLLGLSIILLIVALALLGTKILGQRQDPPINGSASLVDRTQGAQDIEAETEEVFASSLDSSALFSLPGDENGIEIEVIASPTRQSQPPRVLIYHTHTHEAYEQVADDPYESLEAWRTSDEVHSVVRVGEELSERLKALGFNVTHDVTDHEGNQLSTAYTRSLVTLKSYEEPFDLYIDLHRDAYIEGDPIAVVSEQGQELAPLMVLIGNGNGFEEKPWYEENLAFAKALEARINAIEPNLCKPVLVKDGRYNQHIGVFAILVEVGHNRNTLTQALNAVPPLAEAIHSLMIDDPDPSLEAMKGAWQHKYSQ